ncbi:MAG: hypothetical protein EOP48_25715, partial [Sphingobacteriales bacterium]
MQYDSISWQRAWEYPAFRLKLVTGLIILLGILVFAPDYFLYIQSREGVLLNDWLLNELPAVNVSSYIFLMLYPFMALMIWRMVEKTAFCITALWAYIFLCMGRMITIYLIPIAPSTQQGLPTFIDSTDRPSFKLHSVVVSGSILVRCET